MAGNRIALDPASTLLQGAILGLDKTSLENYTTTSEPTIHEGSKLEVGGSLFSFSSDETITDWASMGSAIDVYIKTSSTADSEELTASWTSVAPEWSDTKQGWYDATETNRYIGGCYKSGSTEWKYKYLYNQAPYFFNGGFGVGTTSVEVAMNVGQINNNDPEYRIVGVSTDPVGVQGRYTVYTKGSGQRIAEFGYDGVDVRVSNDSTGGGGSLTIGEFGGSLLSGASTDSFFQVSMNSNTIYIMSEADSKGIQRHEAIRLEVTSNFIHGNGGGVVTIDSIFDDLAPFIPDTNDEMLLTGGIDTQVGTNPIIASKAKRTGANTIVIYGYDTAANAAATLTLTNGVTTNMSASLSW